MQRKPVLAAKSLPAGSDGYRVPLTLRVEGGLHNIRSNHAPYFSLTYTQHRKGFPNQCWSGGAGHEYILQHFPRFSDLAALHLSDIDGVPMNAEGNGWYWLAGAMGGMGERYHGGNREYADNSEAECLRIFARHCRITTDEAMTIRAAVRRAYGATFPVSDKERTDAAAAARAEWGGIMEAMRPRWKQEAAAAIERHNLRVYGDPWPPKQEDTEPNS